MIITQLKLKESADIVVKKILTTIIPHMARNCHHQCTQCSAEMGVLLINRRRNKAAGKNDTLQVKF